MKKIFKLNNINKYNSHYLSYFKNSTSLYSIKLFHFSIDYSQAKNLLEKERENILPKNLSNFIYGEFAKANDLEKIKVLNPTTEEIIGYINQSSKEDVDEAVSSAQKAYHEWNKMALDQRVKLFMKLADLLEENILNVTILESLDNGKNLRDAFEDVKEVVRLIRYYGGYIDKVYGSTFTPYDDVTIQARRVPYGVVGCISPWNYPLLMATWKIIPAIAAGNSVVLKPSEETPLSILKFCELFQKLDFPKGLLNVIIGLGNTTGSYLTRHHKVNKVCFTGSTNAGRQVMLGSAESNLKSVQLELGGKSPLVIFNDADLNNALNWVINGAFFNSSQNCICSSRLLIHEDIYEQFVGMIVEQTKELKVGRYDDPESDLGPLINRKQYDNYFKYLNVKDKENLNLAYGGKSLKDKFVRGFFVDPAIFRDVPDDSIIAKEEIFAPILTILKPFKTTKEAVERANDSIYGLASGVFTTDTSKIEYFVRNVETGNIHVNCYNLSPYNVPFGGMKQSGFGRDCGQEGIMEFTQVKSVYYYTDLSKI